MLNHNNRPEHGKYIDMVVRPRPHQSSVRTYIAIDDEAAIEQAHEQIRYKRRIKRVARIMVLATKNNFTARGRKLVYYKRKMVAGLLFTYRNQYRITAVLCVLVSVFSVVIPPFLQATDTQPISLDAQTAKLVGETRDDAKQYLQYDATKRTYTFQPEKQESGNFEHVGRNKDAYNTVFPKDADSGIKLTDNKTNIDITLTPKFFTSTARKSTGNHLVYKSGRSQLIYSLKYNGLKEDIVIPSPQGSTAQYEFTLSLPSGVEARLDQQGNIGIYSGDSSLYGNISYGSDEDRAKVEKARENSEKTNLLMTIPYPVVKDREGTEYSDLAKFSLSAKQVKQHKEVPKGVPDVNAPKQVVTTNEYVVALAAHGLAELKYPISLDPTIQLGNSSNFTNVNMEGGGDIDQTNTLIKRTGLTGAEVGTWGSEADFGGSGTRSVHTSVVYNGFLYIMGGHGAGSGQINQVDFTTISPTGVLGSTWTNTTSFPTARSSHMGFVNNGYLYIAGGWNESNAAYSDIRYAKLGPTGPIGADSGCGSAWCTASVTLPGGTPIVAGRAITHNNYLYILGGCSNPVLVSSDLYTCIGLSKQINYIGFQANGNITGTWQAGTDFTTARFSFAVNIIGDNLYISGGCSATDFTDGTCATAQVDTQYTKLDSTTGAPSTWTTSTVSLPAAVWRAQTSTYANYIYIYGGTVTNTAESRKVYYAPVYTDGSVGSWKTSTDMPGVRRNGTGFAAAGKIFAVGGSISTGTTKTIVSASIQPAGYTTNWASTTSNPTARWAAGTVAYNGYLYITGGMTTSCNPACNAITNVNFAPISSDGSIGAWSGTTALPSGLAAHKLVAYGGYIYVLGGATSCTDPISSGNFICPGLSTVYYSPANSANGTLGTWVATAGFNNGRWHEAVTALGNHLYLTGGSTCSGTNCSSMSDAQVTEINTDGTLAGWTSITSLPIAKAGHGMVASGNYLYVVGGSTANVYYAQVDTVTGGIVGSWQATTALSSAQEPYISAYAKKGNIYVYGGGFTSADNNPQYAQINTSDGSLGTWNSLPMFSTARTQSSGAMFGDTLYLLDGYTGSVSSRSDVQYLNINNGGPGTIKNWNLSNKSFSTGHTRSGLVAMNGYLYILSGCSTNTNPCTGLTGTIEYTAINADGTLAGWAATSASITPRQGGSYYSYNGRIYAQGGQSAADGSSFTRTIQFATPAANGNITSWTTNAIDVPSNEAYGGVVVYDGYAYRVGGSNGIASELNVSYATINAATGQVGSWSTLNNLNVSHRNHGLVLYKNFIYVVGGLANGNAVEYTSIKTDHTLNSWVLTSSLGIARQEVSAVAYNGTICTISGYNATLNRVFPTECADIFSSGALGYWQQTASVNVRSAGNQTTQYNGLLYTAGGSNSGADPILTAEIAQIVVISRIAQLSRLYDFDVSVRPTKLITRGVKNNGSITRLTYSSSNKTATVLDNGQGVADVGYAGSNQQTINLGTNRTLSRYFWLSYEIDDSASVVYPDVGNESYITDFDLYYIANPGERLRGGRTFTNGIDRGLDTQPQ